MSYDLFVVFTKRNAPTAEEWRKAVEEAGIPFRFTCDFVVTEHDGALPGELNGEPTAFEYYYDAKYRRGRAAVILGCGGEAEIKAGWGVAAVLAVLTEGKVEDPQDDRSLKGEKALTEARGLLGLSSGDERPQLPGDLYLAPADAHWCTWKVSDPVEWTPARTFEREEAVRWLKEAGWPGRKLDGIPFTLERYPMGENITREEAVFLWRAMVLSLTVASKMEDRLRASDPYRLRQKEKRRSSLVRWISGPE